MKTYYIADCRQCRAIKVCETVSERAEWVAEHALTTDGTHTVRLTVEDRP